MARQLIIYYRVRNEFLKEHKLCQVCLGQQIEGLIVPPVMPATDVHHIRGRVGRLLCDPRFFLAVCRRHHDLIRDQPRWAKSHGYIKNWLKTDDL